MVNHYPIEIFWSDEDEGYIAEVPDLPGCSAWGANETDAASEVKKAIRAGIKAAKAAGNAVPVPSTMAPLDSYSGKFVVRVPRSLHARLARKARIEGVSLNQYIMHMLSR